MFKVHQYPCGTIKAHRASRRGIAFGCACGEVHYINWEEPANPLWWLLLLKLLWQRIFTWGQFRTLAPANDKNQTAKNGAAGRANQASAIHGNGYQPFLHQAPNVAASPVTRSVNKITTYPQAPLKKTMLALIQQGWKDTPAHAETNFILHHVQLMPLSLEEAAAKMLRHAARVAPLFNVPLLTPYVVYDLTPINTAGQFKVDGEGWVTITIDQAYKYDKQSSLSILAHELCHYVLESSGIRKADTLDNERMTDVCMFVLGFGDIYLQGYWRNKINSPNGKALRFGYLDDGDYQMLANHVKMLRSSVPETLGVSSRNSELEGKLLNMFMGNRSRMTDNISFYQRKYPSMQETEVMEKILWDWERDRR